MKVLSIITAIALTTSSAMAVETVMGVKGRFDYVRTETKNKTATPATKTTSGVLTTSFLRLVTDAKINDTVSLKLTLDFQPTPAADNNLQNLVDEAFLTKDFGMGFKAMVGKQAIMTGGRENDYSTRDLYLTSKFKSETPDNITGITAGYSMAGQNVYLQYLEQTDVRSAGSPTFTDKKVVGAAYYGSFMDNMLMPILSYHKLGTNRLGAYDIAMSAGLRVTAAKMILIEADYLSMEQEKNGNVAVGGTTAQDGKLTSVVGHVRYLHENFQPFFKYIMDKGTKGYKGLDSTAEKSKRDIMEIGIEYMPSKDEDMRYHIVYDNSTTKRTEAAPSTKITESKIYAGIAFNYNILK